ncbi:MAG: Beta-carotene 15,15'-dioxygenase [Alphaproteobacteria bacterium MarineAlpha11_Bin1]|nr:MAG: Beta-carotene 15,15'-dioxygenase [Alphaproteobacteria bacterium MarineAlpha11_Bin1]
MSWEYSLPMFLIILAGFPHGAADGVLIFRFARQRKLYSAAIFVAYIFVAAVTAIIWFLQPWIGLGSFLLLSIYHFGLLDTLKSRNSAYRIQRIIVLGSLPIITISLAHPDEVTRIFQIISGKGGASITLSIQTISVIWGILLIWLMIFKRAIQLRMIAEMTGLTAALIILPPIWGFAFYFCVLHSPRHFKKIFTVVAPLRREAWFSIAALTFCSAGLVVVFLQWADTKTFDEGMIQSTFIVLAALTTPHMLLIDGYGVIEKLQSKSSGMKR